MELLLLLLATTMLYSSAYLHSNYFYRMKSYSSKNLLKSSDNDESLTNSNVVTVTETKTRAEYALLFDCDGVIVETEELHRIAYNKAFQKYQLQLPGGKPVEWDVAYYDVLQNTVGGGKPKMKYYFNTEVGSWPTFGNPSQPAPETNEAKDQLVDMLQDAKTEFYKVIVQDLAEARPGVLQLMDEAIADPTLKVGICSAATKAGFEKIVDSVVGKERLSKLDVIIAGDDVSKKKPDPMIYNVAKERIGIPAEKCVVIEDSLVGLRAAKAAGMKCIVTYTESTAREDFYGEGADAKISNLGGVTVKDIFSSLKQNGDVLMEKKDKAESIVNKVIENVLEDTAVETVAEAATVSGIVEEVKEFYNGWTPHFVLSKD